MRHRFCVPLVGILAFGLLTLARGQEASDQDSQEGPLFFVVNYMKSTEGKSEEYVDLERKVWKKVHEAKLKDGKSRGWIFLEVLSRGENSPDYDYATIDLYDSPEQMESPYPNDYLSKVLSEDELMLVGNTGASRKLVGTSTWKVESGVMSDSTPSPQGMLVRVNSMQPTEGNEDKYLAAESTAFRKLHQAKIDADHMVAWFLLSSFSSNEEQAAGFMTLDVYRDVQQARSRMSQEESEAALESLSQQQKDMVDSMSVLRTISNRDVWVTIDSVLESDEQWEKQEWSKLTGAWKATLPDGNYRIKRLTEGSEVLEVYNSEGELQRRMESDMAIERYKGLNFFTVRIGTPWEYTSIYKVHEGKWYEQLRGIFADNNRLEPNAFLIYERIEE